jgi:hypothetical protein
MREPASEGKKKWDKYVTSQERSEILKMFDETKEVCSYLAMIGSIYCLCLKDNRSHYPNGDEGIEDAHNLIGGLDSMRKFCMTDPYGCRLGGSLKSRTANKNGVF